MAARPTSSTFPSNRLLRELPAGDLALLKPHFDLVTFARRAPLENPQKPIEHLYFMEHGIASVVIATGRGAPVEVGLVGREGVIGVAIILGSSSSPHSTFIQVAGSALRIAVKPFRKVLDHSKVLRGLLLRYANVLMVQTAETAAANVRGSIEERLARWLLMALDRLDDKYLPLTHEFLAVMLGTRRPDVTEAMRGLAQRGLVRTNRGIVAIVNRKGLMELAGTLYGVPEAEYRRQIGRP